MKLTLGFSPCPNDTFIFDALVNSKIDTGDLQFEPLLKDVQELNTMALADTLDISKISYGVLPMLMNNYDLLESGGALGKGVGPLLIARLPIEDDKINDSTIAIPGKDTTAHLLFSKAFPAAGQKKFMLFSRIEDAVLSGEVDCGVIIHENRFTYQRRGLVKLKDLGEFWEHETGLPIPLGGVVIRKSLDPLIKRQVDNLIKESVQYAFGNYPSLPAFVIDNAQEMEESVMRQHIDLYVNNFSIELGAAGRAAVRAFLSVYERAQQAVLPVDHLFAKSLMH